MILKIRGWKDLFENSESRKLKRLSWVAVPNKLTGNGYTALVDHPNGAAHLGAWYAIVEICSLRDPRELRGTLPESDGTIPGISRSLGRISRLPPEIFMEVLPRLIHDPNIQWIEQDTITSGESPGTSVESPETSGIHIRELQGREGQGNTGDGITKNNAPDGALLVRKSPDEFAAAGQSVVRSDVHPPKANRKSHRTTAEIRASLGTERLSWWENFWRVFPCHEGMKAAMDAFERRIRERADAVAAFHGAQAYAARLHSDPDLKPKWGQGWINDERWLDQNKIVPVSNGRQTTEDLAASIEAFRRTR